MSSFIKYSVLIITLVFSLTTTLGITIYAKILTEVHILHH